MLNLRERFELDDWSDVNIVHVICVSGLAGLIVLAILLSRQGWVPILDDANLAFHEGGHPIYGIFGETLGLYGGTLGQLSFPLLAMGSFYYRGHAASFAVAVIWFFENFFNIARYMADARARELPLVGGDLHDWMLIFTRWRVLSHDTKIANLMRVLGSVGIAAAVAWIFLRMKASRHTSSETKTSRF